MSISHEATTQGTPGKPGVPCLARVTTRYSPGHDRVCLAGALPNGDSVLLWLTQRLLRRMLAPLTTWLEGQDVPQAAAAHRNPAQALYAEAMQGFAQQAAWARIAPEAPVPVDEDGAACLVRSVDLVASPQALQLVFHGPQGAVAAMELQALSLRQWLAIVLGAWRNAEWPLDPWPVWLLESASAPASSAVLH
jgi:hypothetical protein